MLFVFGKRAKKLRLNKVSELIHKSDLYPDVESARVSVHFCEMIAEPGRAEDDDEYRIVPGSQLVVSRVAYANNQSKYTIDDKASTFGEVGELLRSRGIDLDNNRFLILQGEVEQIAMMKPKAPPTNSHEDGLLEYLEDIIGSNKYVEAIGEAEKLVEEACEARSGKLNRLKIAEKEVASLEDLKTEAESFVLKEDEVRRAKFGLYQVFSEESRKNADTLTQRHAELSTRLEAASTDRADLQKEAEEAAKRVDASKKAHSSTSARLDDARRQLAQVETREIEAKEEAKHRGAAMKKLRATVARETAEKEAREAEIEEKEASREPAAAAVEEAEIAAKQAEDTLSQARDEATSRTASTRAELETAQRDLLAPATAALDDAVTRAEKAAREVATAERGSKQAQAELETVTAKISTARSTLATVESSLADVEKRAVGTTRRRKELEKSLKVLAADDVEARRKATEATTALEADRAKKRQIEEARSSKGAAPRAVSEVIAASRRRGGELANAGVRGRLGDLGTLPPEYDIAVSTAAGDMLDHVVVETGAGGQACIEYLKTRGVGRASFLVLAELGQWRARAEKSAAAAKNKGAPRLVDLVRPAHQDYGPAFYMALRETLVAKDLDSAVALAYGSGGKDRNRVVTLGGQLIDSSGTMSGGGGKPKSGKMKLTGSESQEDDAMSDDEDGARASFDEGARLERKAEAAISAADETSQRKAEAEAELRTCIGELETLLELDKPRLEEERRSTLALLEKLEKKAASLRSETAMSEQDEAALRSLRKASDELSRKAEVERESVAKHQATIDELRRAVVAAGGPELERATAAHDECRRELDRAKAEQAAIGLAVQAAQKALKKASVAAAKAEKQLAALEEKDAAADLAELENLAAEAKAACERAAEEAAIKAEELSEAEAGLAEVTQRLDELKASALDLTNQLDDYARAIKENKTKHQHWVKEIAKLREAHATECDTYPEILLGEGIEDGGQLVDSPQEELESQDKEDLKYRVALLEAERDGMRGNVDLKTIAEYRSKQKEYQERLDELAEVTEMRNKARDGLEQLRRKRLDDFMCGFGQIALKLKENYQLLTLGGDAELELVDSLDPFSEGIVFSVRPPKKSWKHIANLSGGEKTLSSLALVFALHHYKPTPLYVMDEIDAALDFKNVSIIANYIKERCQSAQFVIISLRNNMFELADRLVGIYKVNQCTRTVCISPKQYAFNHEANDADSSPILRDSTNVGGAA